MKDIRNEHFREGPDGKRDIPKIAYRTRKEATEFLENHYNNTRAWSVYKCLICGKWHIGHSNRITTEEKLKIAREDIRYLIKLIEKRDEEIYKLREELCYYLNPQK